METETPPEEEEAVEKTSEKPETVSPFEEDTVDENVKACEEEPKVEFPDEGAKAAPEVTKVSINAQAVVELYNHLLYAMNHGAFSSYSFDETQAMSASAIVVREGVRSQVPTSGLAPRQQ